MRRRPSGRRRPGVEEGRQRGVEEADRALRRRSGIEEGRGPGVEEGWQPGVEDGAAARRHFVLTGPGVRRA